MFLTDEQLARLTGISKGRNGKTREQLQAEQLRKQGIPFYLNARDRPVVVSDVLTGRQAAVPPKAAWQPKPLQSR